MPTGPGGSRSPSISSGAGCCWALLGAAGRYWVLLSAVGHEDRGQDLVWGLWPGEASPPGSGPRPGVQPSMWHPLGTHGGPGAQGPPWPKHLAGHPPAASGLGWLCPGLALSWGAACGLQQGPDDVMCL